MPSNGWIGVDFDGTLAEYPGGKPIKKMVKRVLKHLRDGEEVRIFTARASSEDEVALQLERRKIVKWCKKYLGVILPITCRKDYDMRFFYDDRAVHVERNTGRILG